jgi:hypothetical protein
MESRFKSLCVLTGKEINRDVPSGDNQKKSKNSTTKILKITGILLI